MGFKGDLLRAGIESDGNTVKIAGASFILSACEIECAVLDQDVYSQSATQKFPLGTKLIRGERIFRYAKNGAGTLAAGKLVQSAAYGGFTSKVQEDLACSTVAADATSVTITLDTDAAVANLLKDGYLIVNSGVTGIGEFYKIKSNAAGSAGSTCVLTLYDKVVSGLDATATAIVMVNPFKAVVIASATVTGAPVMGVPIFPITAAYYFWLQTAGPCAVLADGAATIGVDLCRSNGANGAVEVDAAGASSKGQEHVGRALQAADTGDYALIWLSLE